MLFEKLQMGEQAELCGHATHQTRQPSMLGCVRFFLSSTSILASLLPSYY